MSTTDFITQLLCSVGGKLGESGSNHKHSQAKLYPSEVVTLALLARYPSNKVLSSYSVFKLKLMYKRK